MNMRGVHETQVTGKKQRKCRDPPRRQVRLLCRRAPLHHPDQPRERDGVDPGDEVGEAVDLDPGLHGRREPSVEEGDVGPRLVGDRDLRLECPWTATLKQSGDTQFLRTWVSQLLTSAQSSAPLPSSHASREPPSTRRRLRRISMSGRRRIHPVRMGRGAVAYRTSLVSHLPRPDVGKNQIWYPEVILVPRQDPTSPSVQERLTCR